MGEPQPRGGGAEGYGPVPISGVKSSEPPNMYSVS